MFGPDNKDIAIFPEKVLARSREPLLFPETRVDKEGMMPNVVFHNGLVENGYGTLTLYYGAGDETTCGATVSVAEILNSLTTTKGVCA